MNEDRMPVAKDGDTVCFTIHAMRQRSGWQVMYQGLALAPNDGIERRTKEVDGLLDSEVAQDLYEATLWLWDIGTRELFSPHELDGQDELPFD